MGKITKINLQKSSKRANIFIDGKFKFGIDLDNLLKSGLKTGREINERQLHELVFKAEVSKLLESMGKFLSLRPRSRKEIEDRIALKIFRKKHPEFIDREKLKKEVLGKIEKTSFINDEEFSVWFVSQRNSFKPKSKRALFFELKKKGVDSKTINQVLEDFDDEKTAFKLIEKKKYTFSKLAPQERKKKIISFLTYRGFNWPVIKKVLEIH